MQTNPLVSIIIPTYNRAHLIGETLESVLRQTYTNWECIVINDCSTDDTEVVVLDYVKKDARIKYYIRPEDYKSGGNGARNYGFSLSKGDYINWFDDDDVMLENFIECKISLLKEENDFIIASGYYVNSNLDIQKKMKIFNSDFLFRDFLKWNIEVITNSVMFKRAFLENKQLFSDKIKRGQEAELFSRLFFQVLPHQYKIVEECLFLYRQHEDTKTFKSKSYLKDYKESQTYIYIENFKRSLDLKDVDLIRFFYKLLLNLFFRGIENNHIDNSKTILNSLISIIFKYQKTLAVQLFFFGQIVLHVNKGRSKIEKWLLKKTIKIS